MTNGDPGIPVDSQQHIVTPALTAVANVAPGGRMGQCGTARRSREAGDAAARDRASERPRMRAPTSQTLGMTTVVRGTENSEMMFDRDLLVG